MITATANECALLGGRVHSLVFVDRNGQSQLWAGNLQSRDDNATRFKTNPRFDGRCKRTQLSTLHESKPTKTSLGYLHRPESVTAYYLAR
jgi:hypothetical protein